MTPDTAALRELAADAPSGPPRAVRIAATIGNAATGVESAYLIGIDPDTVRALCDAAEEVERLRKAVWASEEIDRRAGMLAGVEAERDASRTAHAALVAELRALHRPTAAVDHGAEYDACVTCFDEYERPTAWPCPTAALLDRHAPTTGATP